MVIGMKETCLRTKSVVMENFIILMEIDMRAIGSMTFATEKVFIIMKLVGDTKGCGNEMKKMVTVYFISEMENSM